MPRLSEFMLILKQGSPSSLGEDLSETPSWLSISNCSLKQGGTKLPLF